MRFLLLVLAAVLAPQSALAIPEDVCAEAAANAAARHDVPYDLMMAVGRVESGRETSLGFMPWPWSINVAGEGAQFASADALLVTAEDLIAKDQDNFDLGCFQINYHWHGDGFADVSAMIDPETNADFAAALLRKQYDEKGDWLLAAGAYHSETPDKAEIYRAKVTAALGQPLPDQPVELAQGGLTKADANWFLKTDLPAVATLGSLVNLACTNCEPQP